MILLKREGDVMRKLTIAVILILLSAVVVTASTGLIIKVNGENKESALESLRSSIHVLYNNIGNYYFENEDYPEAEKYFKKSIAIKNDYASAHHNLGVIYYKDGNFDLAISEFKEAVRLDESYSKAHYSLALLYRERGLLNEAIEQFTILTSLEESNPNAHFDLGVSYVDRFRKDGDYGKIDDLNKALENFQKSDDLSPGFPHAKENIEIVKLVLEHI